MTDHLPSSIIHLYSISLLSLKCVSLYREDTEVNYSLSTHQRLLSEALKHAYESDQLYEVDHPKEKKNRYMPIVIKLVIVGTVKDMGRGLQIYSGMNEATIGDCPFAKSIAIGLFMM